MDRKPLRQFVLAGMTVVGLANVAFAQVNENAEASNASLFEKIAIGVGAWLATAILAYVAWNVAKIVAKIGVVGFPILAGVGVAATLPHPITSDAVMAIGIPYVLSGVAASLVCYLYANFYDIERELHKVEQETLPKTVG
jgi:hypothetical protein